MCLLISKSRITRCTVWNCLFVFFHYYLMTFLWMKFYRESFYFEKRSVPAKQMVYLSDWFLFSEVLSHLFVCLSGSCRRRWMVWQTGWSWLTTPWRETGPVGKRAWELTSNQPLFPLLRRTWITTRRWAQDSDQSPKKFHQGSFIALA